MWMLLTDRLINIEDHPSHGDKGIEKQEAEKNKK
jgi:hypothetical protein